MPEKQFTMQFYRNKNVLNIKNKWKDRFLITRYIGTFFLYLISNQKLLHQMTLCLKIPGTYAVNGIWDGNDSYRYFSETISHRNLKLLLMS